MVSNGLLIYGGSGSAASSEGPSANGAMPAALTGFCYWNTDQRQTIELNAPVTQNMASKALIFFMASSLSCTKS